MLSLRHNSSFVILLTLLNVLAVRAASQETGVPLYRVSSSEVRVTFFATDSAGHPIDAITRDDFAIVDGGTIIRDFRSLARSEKTAVDAVILIDSSQSVSASLRSTASDVLQALSHDRAGMGDSISIISFSGLQAVALCVRDCRGQVAAQKLLSVKASGATPLFDAIAYSANMLWQWRASGARPVVILFSDGNDTISRISGSEALQSLVESGAQLYAIDVNDAPRSQGSAVLQQLAEVTGGQYFSPQQRKGALLNSVLEDLRDSWVVTYELPDRTWGFHSLRMLPKRNSKLQFHCRGGYYYGTSVR